MDEPREHIVYKVLDFTFLGKHDNPGDAIFRDLWTGFAAVGLIMVGGRLWNLTGWRGLLRVIMELAGIWLIGVLLRAWYSSSD
jgi:hypothetical protein